MNNKNYDIILTGVGGQGVITLLSIIDEAAFLQGFDVKSSELHGLSQRGGSVEAHVRFGKKINSPMVSNGQADLILAFEALEGLRESAKAGKQTKVLINDYNLPFLGSPAKDDVLNKLKEGKKDYTLVPASNECKEKLQKEVVCTLWMLGYAVGKNIMPLKKESVIKAIENLVPEKYLELNKKAFDLGFNYNA